MTSPVGKRQHRLHNTRFVPSEKMRFMTEKITLTTKLSLMACYRVLQLMKQTHTKKAM